MNKHRLRKRLIRLPDLAQMILGERWLLMILSGNMLNSEPSISIVGDETGWKLAVERKLIFREQTHDGLDAQSANLYYPRVNFRARDRPPPFAGLARSAATSQHLRNHPREHLVCPPLLWEQSLSALA